jgi:hypothetical protein
VRNILESVRQNDGNDIRLLASKVRLWRQSFTRLAHLALSAPPRPRKGISYSLERGVERVDLAIALLKAFAINDTTKCID